MRLFTMRLFASIICSALLTAPVAAALGPTLRDGDQVTVTVYNHPELSTVATIASDGSVAVPVVGNVAAAGVTTDVLAQRVQLALGAYLRHPEVGVRVSQQGQSIFVTGAMVGVLPYQPGETITSALGALRTQVRQENPATLNIDPSTTSYDLRNVKLDHDGQIAGPIDVEQLNRTGQPGPALAPGDHILLSNKPVRVDVRGDVKVPGPVYLYQGETLSQAVDEAGGVQGTSSTKRIRLTRHGETRTVSVAGDDFTSPAQDNDIVTMLPAPHINVLGQVGTPGDTLLRSDTNLLNAIYNAGGPTRRADLKHVRVVHDGVNTEYNIAKLVHADFTQNPRLSDGDTVFIPEGRGVDPTLFLEAIGAVAGLHYTL